MLKNTEKKMQGSITIFLALSLTLIISVILSTIESSRRLAVSAYLEGVTALGMDSVFSNYCTQLWEDYHVFALISDTAQFNNSLEEYIEPNINSGFLKSSLQDITINEVTNLTDNYGEFFINQIISYMQYEEISYIADYLFADSDIDYNPSSLGTLADGELTADDFNDIDFGTLYEQVITANENLTDEDFETDISLSDTFSIDALKSLTHIFDDALIYYLVESPADVSKKTISYTGLPSFYMKENIYSGTKKYDMLDRFLFSEYLINHFSSYTTPVKDSTLDYQLEYLLCGMKADDENLVEAARSIILLRFGFNVIHILTDKEKINTVNSISKTVSIIPALPVIIEILLISIWALAESVIDVRDLLADKKVPLIKTADQWTLSLANILNFDYSTKSLNSGDNGLTYNNYLEILIFNENTHLTAAKALDLIQLDFSTNINESFSIINCIIGASCDFKYSSHDIFSSVNFYHKTYFAPVYTITHNYYY